MILRFLNAIDQLQRLGAILHFPFEHLQARLTAGQRVAALVGEAGHHLPDGRQPLGLQQLLLGALEILLGPPVFGDAAEPGPHFVGVDRLEDVVGGPQANGRHRPLHVGMAGHDDDRCLGGELP